MTPEEMIIVADRSTSMKEVLTELGYEIWKVPLQIPCPVHKLGQETRPSARIYEDDRAVWCFYCVTQYTATQVWSAMKGVEQGEAAATILSRWPVDEGRAREVLRRAQAPYRPRLVEVYQAVLDRHLISHRGSAGFAKYRKWAKACDDFMVFIGTIPQESQEIAIQSFVDRLNMDLLGHD
jgi:hypothetical protein